MATNVTPNRGYELPDPSNALETDVVRLINAINAIDEDVDALLSDSSDSVLTTGNQTIGGTKTFTDSPIVPTAAAGDNSTKAASTAFVHGALASPDLTGTPTAPTAAPGTNTTQIATTAFVAAAVSGVGGGDTLPAGMLAPYAGSTAPAGWLLCNGQAVSRTTYAALFAAIGTTHGNGNGTSTFNVPDLRGRTVAGKDDMGGTAANRLTSAASGVDGATLGAGGGAQTHTLSVTEMPAHAHPGSTTASAGDHSHTYTGALGSWNMGVGEDTRQVIGSGDNTSTAGAHTHTVNIASQGGGGAHNNVQPTIVLNYIIKA